MSLQERLGSQNAMQLLGLAAGLSMPSAGVTYNFALMLFGIVAHELTTSTEPLRLFLMFLAFSTIFDVLSILSGESSGLIFILAIIILVLKAPIFYSCMNSLRNRGSDLRWGVPSGLQGGLQGLGERVGGGQGGWSMPGGFGNASSQPAQTAGGAGAQGTFPSSGGFRLGGEDDEAQAGPPPAPAPGRNGYSSIA
ncbi:hypothetical protein EHS25_010138 [Saitozyma podzolica]|uniref:Uncharacterized protein n=1 Tax=Saitozyma podzolica TaxID=1890683 RepID=A0A427YIQ1_9TREE|nr:hypothetical protein EHS25_010138 [Saitozyma podzolica]